MTACGEANQSTSCESKESKAKAPNDEDETIESEGDRREHMREERTPWPPSNLRTNGQHLIERIARGNRRGNT